MVESRSMVSGQTGWPSVAGSGPSLPSPGQQFAAHPIQLAHMAPPEAAQEGAQGGRRLDYAAESAGRPAGAQRIGVAMQSPPASAEVTRVEILSPGLARPGASPRPCLSVVRLDRALSTPIRCSHHADLGLRSHGPTVRRGLHHQRRRRTAPRTAALKCGL